MAAITIWHLHIWSGWAGYYPKTSPDIISKSILTTHKVTRNLKFWPKIIGYPLWKKIQDGGHHNLTSPYMVWMSWLLPKNITRHHFQVHFDHTQSYKKFEILTQNHRLSPLEKNPRWRPSQFDISIYGLDELVATQKYHQISFPSPFWPQTKLQEIWNFDPKS